MRAPAGIGPLGFFVLMLGLGLRLDTAWQGLAWVLIHYLVPLLPTGGSLGWLWAALHWLAGAGIVIAMIPLAPPVSMFVGGLLFDAAAGRVEDAIGAKKGRDPSILAGVGLALRIAIPALVLNLIALPLAMTWRSVARVRAPGRSAEPTRAASARIAAKPR